MHPPSIHGDFVRTWTETWTAEPTDSHASYCRRGCAHQASIGFYLYNGPEYTELFLACSKASLVHVNTNYRYGVAELTYLWDNADAEVIVFHGSFSETAAEVRPEIPASTPGSGSTTAQVPVPGGRHRTRRPSPRPRPSTVVLARGTFGR